MSRKPNLLGVDSLRADPRSLYGHKRLTTPPRSAEGVVFESSYSPSTPTSPGYASPPTGLDRFGTDVVAPAGRRSPPEVLKAFNASSVPSPVGGFDVNLSDAGWGPQSPKAENLNAVAIPELKRLLGLPEEEYAQRDGAVVSTDAWTANLFSAPHDLEEGILAVLAADHGETLDEQDCRHDRHGLDERTLARAFRVVPAGRRLPPRRTARSPSATSKPPKNSENAAPNANVKSRNVERSLHGETGSQLRSLRRV